MRSLTSTKSCGVLLGCLAAGLLVQAVAPAPAAAAGSIIIGSPVVTSPGAGDTWRVGRTYQIAWQGFRNTDRVKIELYWGSRLNRTIADSAPNPTNGGKATFNWTVPSGQATGTGFTVRVTALGKKPRGVVAAPSASASSWRFKIAR